MYRFKTKEQIQQLAASATARRGGRAVPCGCIEVDGLYLNKDLLSKLYNQRCEVESFSDNRKTVVLRFPDVERSLYASNEKYPTSCIRPENIDDIETSRKIKIFNGEHHRIEINFAKFFKDAKKHIESMEYAITTHGTHSLVVYYTIKEEWL